MSQGDRLGQLYNFVSERVDRVLLAQTPLVMMPRHCGLPPLRVGERRYVAASDGIYVQAKSLSLEVTLRYAPTPPLPFGVLSENIAMIGGLLPASMFSAFAALARQRAPVEAAALVRWNAAARCYELLPRTALAASVGHITYAVDDLDDESIVLDLHSHGDFDAFFSGTDDHSDLQGVHLSSVLGRCRDENGPMIKTRICVDGFFYPVPWAPWEACDATHFLHA